MTNPTATPHGTPDTGLGRLADRLLIEYSGALPPGQVLAILYRADRVLSPRSAALPVAAQLVTLEAVVRRSLTDRLAVLSAESRGVLTHA